MTDYSELFRIKSDIDSWVIGACEKPKEVGRKALKYLKDWYVQFPPDGIPDLSCLVETTRSDDDEWLIGRIKDYESVSCHCFVD